MMRNLRFGLGVAAAAAGLLTTWAGPVRADVVIEGFENGNLSNYTAIDGGGQITATVAATYAHDGQFGLGLDGTDWYLRTTAPPVLSQNSSFFAWVRPGDLNSREYFGFGASATQTYAAVVSPRTNTFEIQLDNPTAQTFNTLSSTPFAGYQANNYYKVAVNWSSSGLITSQLFDSDGTTLLATTSVTNNAITSGTIAFRGFSGASAKTGSFDTVTLVQPSAVGPEPSCLALVTMGGGIGIVLRGRRIRPRKA